MLVTLKTKIALFINIFSYKILILINYHPISTNKMTEKEIQTILDTLGNRVSQLSEDNRLHKLLNELSKFLSIVFTVKSKESSFVGPEVANNT